MEMLGEFGEFLLWMAYFQSSVSRESTIASSNAFTENVTKRKKGVSAPQSSRISLCCCIRLLQMRSTVMFLERSCHRLVGYGALTGTAEELPQTYWKLSWLHLSLQICGKQECRQTNYKGREAEYIKITWYCSKGFWENPAGLNRCNELSKKKKNRKSFFLLSCKALLLNPSNGSSAPLQSSLKSCCISRWHDMVFICTGSADKSPWLHHCILWLLQQGATLLCLLHQTENNHYGALQLQLPASCTMGRFDLDFKRPH